MAVSRALGPRRMVAVAAVVLATACTAQTEADDPAPSEPNGSRGPSGPGVASTSADPGAATVLDPAYAMEAPGRRTGPVAVADILISSEAALSPEVLERVAGLDGVEAVTTISLANVPVENKLYTVAAVDASQYRRFTVSESADFQEQWDRVAAGEVAVSTTLAKRLPVDDRGYVRLGMDDDDLLHVGAWAPQAEQIDMVVNDLRGEALGLVPDNAMLVNTGQTSPETLREPIEEIVGDGLSVQNLDAVARFGLDPDAVQSIIPVGSFGDAVGVFNYTSIGGGRIAPDPAWVSSHISTEAVPILGSVTCNRFLMPQLEAALGEIVSLGLQDEINVGDYGGCYNPRFIAGSTTLSNHSFGLALDLNVPGNGRGTVGEIDRGVVAVFKRWGFAWGGDWNYTDPMHFELERIVRPG